ncbi:hypothetical protein [Nocardia pseudovaccinii]|uniref:hypothetical protein n=1 Tax=Nocardia pseudovaccinii TaxID=189540 RepID=UPI0007A4EE75|nr:hypothetical protein [Nocardia pseudovaccinii]
MNSVLWQGLFGVGCIGTGFLAGLSLSWREYKLAGKKFNAPALPKTDRQQALVLVVVALLSVVSVAYAGVETARQSGCNEDFKQSLVARSAIATENQRHIDDLMGTVADAISNPGPDSRAHAQQAILDYRTWAVQAERERADHPIADPQCG